MVDFHAATLSYRRRGPVAPNWTNATSGMTNPITIPATLPAKYYRLHKP